MRGLAPYIIRTDGAVGGVFVVAWSVDDVADVDGGGTDDNNNALLPLLI